MLLPKPSAMSALASELSLVPHLVARLSTRLATVSNLLLLQREALGALLEAPLAPL
jgi:hypothetical protein